MGPLPDINILGNYIQIRRSTKNAEKELVEPIFEKWQIARNNLNEFNDVN